MRKKRLYLFKGAKIMAYSKDEVLRAYGVRNYNKSLAMITKLKPRGGKL